jgi:hypothetical protein
METIKADENQTIKKVFAKIQEILKDFDVTTLKQDEVVDNANMFAHLFKDSTKDLVPEEDVKVVNDFIKMVASNLAYQDPDIIKKYATCNALGSVQPQKDGNKALKNLYTANDNNEYSVDPSYDNAQDFYNAALNSLKPVPLALLSVMDPL